MIRQRRKPETIRDQIKEHFIQPPDVSRSKWLHARIDTDVGVVVFVVCVGTFVAVMARLWKFEWFEFGLFLFVVACLAIVDLFFALIFGCSSGEGEERILERVRVREEEEEEDPGNGVGFNSQP